jgi:hypothetical protein
MVTAGTVASCTTSHTSSTAHVTTHTSTTSGAPTSPSESSLHPEPLVSDSSQAADPKALLLTASDAGPGAVVKTPASSISNNGVTGATEALSSPDGSRVIGDTVLLYPSSTAAAAGLRTTVDAARASVQGAFKTVDVGADGVMGNGTDASDASKSSTIVVFREGSAVVTLAFQSAAKDPIPSDAALSLAATQDSKLQNVH